MNVVLLRALRIVIRADSDPARQVLFRRFREAHALARLAYGVHARLNGWSAAWLVAAYGVAAFLGVGEPRRRDARVIVAAVHANARRQASWACRGIGDCGWVRTGRAAWVSWSLPRRLWALAAARRKRATLALVRAVDGRHGFLVASRVACALAWYARSRALIAAHRPGAVLVSSDSNPEEVGFVAAARSLGVPRVFVSHAFPTPYTPRLDFTLSVLEGEAALEARRRAGPPAGAVLIAGVEGESHPLRPDRLRAPEPCVGIFTPKAVSWETLTGLVRACHERFRARRVVIRWHPSMLERPRLPRTGGDGLELVESPRGAPLADVAAQCDWVIGDENSNVHLQVLRLGIPTVAVRRLGLYPPSHQDMYGFIASRVVYPSTRALEDMDVEDAVRFYGGAWRDRFERYDGAYLRPREDVGRDVGAAVRALWAPPPGTASR